MTSLKAFVLKRTLAFCSSADVAISHNAASNKNRAGRIYRMSGHTVLTISMFEQCGVHFVSGLLPQLS